MEQIKSLLRHPTACTYIHSRDINTSNKCHDDNDIAEL